MFETLYLFLIRNKQLILPEIGTLSVQMDPAKTEFINRQVLPPKFRFQFSRAHQAIASRFFVSLAHTLQVSETEAIVAFNDFVLQLKNELENGNVITWNRLGEFRKDDSGNVVFEPGEKKFSFYQNIPATKVLRENVKHVVLVGEREKTASEISDVMQDETEVAVRKTNWWLWPVAAIVILLIFIGWYFSENGIQPSSSGNTEKISTKDAPSGFYFVK